MLSRMVSIKMLLIFDIYRIRFPLDPCHVSSNSLITTYLVELFELPFLVLPYQEDRFHVFQSDET